MSEGDRAAGLGLTIQIVAKQSRGARGRRNRDVAEALARLALARDQKQS